MRPNPEEVLSTIKGRPVKIFLVLEDDDDRENVLECRADNVRLTMEPDFTDVLSDYAIAPVARYMLAQAYYIERIQLMPMEDNAYVKVRNFLAEDRNEDEELDGE